MTIHANNKRRIKKMGKHACVWSKSPQWWPSMKNSVMHATVVRCKRKLKWCFYNLIYIKTAWRTHWNQIEITHTKRNTKSDKNAPRDMQTGLTSKQLNWMCRQLLDVMWDVRAARLMWGMSSARSGWWVWVTSKLWRACHNSRESDTWWEVSEMILACNFQLLKIVPWKKGCLCMMPWEKQPMHASLFFSVLEGTDQLSGTCKRLLDC